MVSPANRTLSAVRPNLPFTFLNRDTFLYTDCPGDTMDLLKRLIMANGVSGDENEVRALIHKEIKAHVDHVEVDKMGNLICHRKGSKPTVLLAAHMDEVGLIVKGITSEGLLFCAEVGGLIPLTLIGEKVLVRAKKGQVHGWLTTRKTSASTEHEELPTMKDIFIDTGLDAKELEAFGVSVGSYVSFDKHSALDIYGKKIAGKALDNRIGCYILIQLARALKKSGRDVFFVFTVQEEIGLYGAWTSMYTLQPDWGIAVDTCVATDLLDEPNKISLGKGPVLTVMDDRLIASRDLNEHLSSLAAKNGINFQLDITDRGTTDASVISLQKGGVPSTVLSVPVRNMHMASGIAHQRDIENAIKLLSLLLENPPASSCRL